MEAGDPQRAASFAAHPLIWRSPDRWSAAVLATLAVAADDGSPARHLRAHRAVGRWCAERESALVFDSNLALRAAVGPERFEQMEASLRDWQARNLTGPR